MNVNDLKDLLERALTDGHGPARHAHADAAGDLARGKRLLRRRARNRVLAASAAAAVAAAVAVPVALHGSPGQGTTGGTTAKSATKNSTAPANGTASRSGTASAPVKVKLVAYTGAQPPGYVVKEIPAGWVIQGTNAYALTIAPAHFADTNPDSFLGKLVVMQGEFSPADAAADGWVATTAGGRTAYFNPGQAGGGTVTAGFVIKQAPGRWLTTQAPASLGWTEAQFKEFALGITILATAKPTKG